MSLPYTISSSPKTTPISAKGLNDNFTYLDVKSNSDGMGVPPSPPDPSNVYILASRGGFLFWIATEEC
jgi:hypothetical protein